MTDNLLKNKSPQLAVLILFQLILLTLMVFNSYTVILWGEKIVLPVEPLDPRSLFQGDYVILGYSFNTLDLSTIRHDIDPAKIKRNQPVYLAFTSNGAFQESSFLTQNPAMVKGETYIKGKVQYMSPPPLTPEDLDKGAQYKELPPAILHASWGIEQYYVPEGKGKTIEEQINHGTVYAQVSVYKGKARVTGLITE